MEVLVFRRRIVLEDLEALHFAVAEYRNTLYTYFRECENN